MTESPGSAQTAKDSEDGDVLGWALAVSPLAVTVAMSLLVLLDLLSGFQWLGALSLLTSAVLVLADKVRLTRSGRSSKDYLPATAWFLVPPAYLWRRAICLGRPKIQFWIWMACAAGALVVRVTILELLVPGLAVTAELPRCASRDIVDDVRTVFENLPVVRQEGLKVVSLSDQQEAGQQSGDGLTVRRCTGTMLASDDNEYPVSYALEQRREEVIIHIRLR